MRRRGFKIFLSVLLIFVVVVVVKRVIRKNTAIDSTNVKQESNPAQSPLVSTLVKSVFIDFESKGELTTEYHVTEEKAVSGKKSLHINNNVDYGDAWVSPLSSLTQDGKINRIVIHFKMFSKTALQNVKYVVTVNNAEGKSVYWGGCEMDRKKFNWEEDTCEFILNPDELKPEYTVHIYPWNVDKKSNFFIDDFGIDFYANVSANSSELKSNAEKASSVRHNFDIDFENPEGLEAPQTIADDVARSGKHSCKLSSSSEYGSGIKKQIKDVTEDSLKDVFVSAWIYSETEKNDLCFVAIVASPDGQTKTWQGKASEGFKFKKHEWQLMNAWLNVSEGKPAPDDHITVYLWNRGKTNLHVDDMLVVFGRQEVREGKVPDANMTELKNSEYKSERNIPPFETGYLQKTSLKNNDGVFLNNTDSLTKLLPDAKYFTGNFLANDAKDEIAVIHKNSLRILSYCSSDKYFKAVFAGDKKYFSDPSYAIVNGNFSGANKNEILVINKVNGQGYLNEFNSKGDACTGKVEMKETEMAIPVTNLSSTPLAIDVNNDGKDELFVCDMTSSKWLLWENTGKFELMASGSLTSLGIDKQPPSVIRSTGQKNFLVVTNGAGSKIFTYSAASKTFSTTYSDSKNILNKGDEYFTTGENQYYIYNRQKRFDLKEISFDNQGIVILKSMDFHGYEKDQNPKYYEMTKLLAGKFTDANKISLLVISANCDGEFDGDNCKTFSKLDYLPNKVEVYNCPAN